MSAKAAAKKPAVTNGSVKELERSMVSVASLNVAKYNPRTIDDAALTALGESVKRFGLVQEIVVNRATMTIISGHQRLKVIKDKYESVPVVFVDLSEPEEKALNIALNSDKLAGSFTDSLQGILDEIEASRSDLFDDLRLGELRTEIVDEALKDREMEYKNRLEVVVECENEAQQEELYERLTAEGFSVKILAL
jgi:ParB-like chromosome segregation protein Spo0J